MKINKAFKFRIYPTESQKLFFIKTFGCCRFIWNKMLEDKINYYKQENKYLKTTPAQYKNTYTFLKEVDSLALSNVQLQLECAYRNFFKNKSFGFPKWKSKKNTKASYTTNHIRIDKKLYLPKTEPIKIKLHRQIPDKYKIKSATITKESTGKYFISILCETDFMPVVKELKTAVGLDFSMKELFVSSNNVKGKYPQYYRNAQKKLSKLQKQLTRKLKDSKRKQKFKLKIAKIHDKIKNQRLDFLHKLSCRITNDYDIVCIEDLNMQQMSKTLNFGKSVYDNSWGIFTNLLKYKLIDKGGKLVKIDKFFPSTKTCSCCGNVQNIKLAERIYKCNNCGTSIDRDYNSAKNILYEGLKILQAGLQPKRLLKKEDSNLSVRSKPKDLSFGI